MSFNKTFGRLHVDVTDNAGVVQGDGPLFNIISIEVAEVLDEAGKVTVTVPYSDTRAIALLSASNRRVVPHIDGEQLRTGIVHQFNPLLSRVSGPDLLGELAYLNCGYDRVYDDYDIKTEVVGATGTAASLLASTGWTQGSVEDLGKTTIKFDAETRLRALIMLAQQTGRHIRQGSTEQTLDFGLFGVDSGVRVINVDGFRPGMEDSDIIALVGAQPTLTRITADIFNRIYPLGKDRFDLRYASTYQIDVEGPATGVITNATNANPIVITSVGHNLSTSDYVRIIDVAGNTAANGDWQITVLTADTFSLDGSVGNGGYTSGGRWDKVVESGILVAQNGGPLGVSATVAVAGITAGDTAFTVSSATGLVEGQELFFGDVSDWTQDHEVAVIFEIAGATITIVNDFENNYAVGTDVIQAPQFYIEDAASQATHGVREMCPQFGWIGPISLTSSIEVLAQAADSLYTAAKAHLIRYKDEYTAYGLSSIFNFPRTIRVGEKIRLVYKGTVGLFGGEMYVDVDDLFYILSITRTYSADGKDNTALEIASASRPNPTNASIVLWNLDENRWAGLG